MFCCSRSKKKPGSPYTRRDVICKKGLFALMLARVDEFDTLTPLIATPTSQPSDMPTPMPRPTLPQAKRIATSDSPPPPRRAHPSKTLIVPLNASRFPRSTPIRKILQPMLLNLLCDYAEVNINRTPVAPLLGTPDSRITSFEAGTTKSCATIPEDDENESPSCERIEDLVSIDRTTTSASEQKSRRGFYSYSSYNLILPTAPPEFQIPVPQYSPPSLPRGQHRPRKEVGLSHAMASPEEPTCSNSIGRSSRPSSISSPVDTTGSISDSFYINSDVISSANGSQAADEAAYTESDLQSKYQLHRIEEESEALDDHLRAGARYAGSVDQGRNFVIPRSISEQFELMRRC